MRPTPLHAVNLVADDATQAGADVENQSPKRALSAERRHAAARASELLGRAAAHTCGQAAVARAVGVSGSHFSRWCDPEHDAAMTLRDIMASPMSFMRAVGIALIEQAAATHATSIPVHLRILRVGAEVGDVHRVAAEALADGVLTDQERDLIAQHADRAAKECSALAREMRRREET